MVETDVVEDDGDGRQYGRREHASHDPDDALASHGDPLVAALRLYEDGRHRSVSAAGVSFDQENAVETL